MSAYQYIEPVEWGDDFDRIFQIELAEILKAPDEPAKSEPASKDNGWLYE